MTTYKGIVHVVHRPKGVASRGRPINAIAQCVVGAGDATKVEGQVASGANDSPIVVRRHEDLAVRDAPTGDLQSVGAIRKGDDGLLADGGHKPNEAGDRKQRA